MLEAPAGTPFIQPMRQRVFHLPVVLARDHRFQMETGAFFEKRGLQITAGQAKPDERNVYFFHSCLRRFGGKIGIAWELNALSGVRLCAVYSLRK